MPVGAFYFYSLGMFYCIIKILIYNAGNVVTARSQIIHELEITSLTTSSDFIIQERT